MLIIDDEMIKRLGRLTCKINEIVPNLLKRNIEVVTGEKINGQIVVTIKRIDAEQSPVGTTNPTHHQIHLSNLYHLH